MNVLTDITRTLRLVPRRRQWQWGLLVPLALGAALLEGLGAGMVLTLGTVVADPARMTGVPGLQWLPRAALPANPTGLVVVVSGLVIMFYVVRGLLLTGFVWIQDTVVQRTASEVATRLLRSYLLAPYALHLRRNSATAIQAVGTSVESAFALGLGSGVNIATEALTLLGLMAILALAAPLATGASAAALALVLLGPMLVVRRTARKLGAESKRLNEVLLQDVQQGLALLKETRIMGVEGHVLSAFAGRRGQLAATRAGLGALSTGARLLVETSFIVAATVAVMAVSTADPGGPGVIGVLALYAYAAFRIVPSANRLTLNFALLQSARPHIATICDDLERFEPLAAAEAEAAAPPFTFSRRIDVDAVSYAYDDDRGAALHEVRLAIRHGESVGLVGSTGAGKSTLVDVLLGLLEPQSGTVRVDGIDIRTNLRGWQQRIGYVAQAFGLLDDTLRRNVAFGVPDERIDDARIGVVLGLAHLDDLVASLPDGLETRIGERGARLSGGERQRVAIARALYRNPDVLVLDEATSALDNQTERAIVSALGVLRGVKTTVVVAHRLSTVRACDRLILLGEGRVVGEGTYDELLERHAEFRGLVSAGRAP
jgi:ATP-binding cassette subfamily C protein